MELDDQSTNPMSLDLRRVSRDDATRAGVKAATLGSLLQAGFPVPPGVVLTPGVDSVDDGELEDVLESVLDQLGDTAVAVRSSALDEDLPEASFAGQYETILGVRGLEELLEAVPRCFASAGSSHLDAYRRAHEIGRTPMAVLIQPMVDADSAGVAFSANPVTGNREEVVINAVRGLGEQLVSGRVSPDEWVVDRQGARRNSSPEPAIDGAQARAIADLARQVENHFSIPQDIEWAIADGEVHLLQARPITALPDPSAAPIPLDDEIPPGFWFLDPSHAPQPHMPIDRILLPLVPKCSRRWSEEFGYLFDGVEFREIRGWAYQRMIPFGDREGPTLPDWLMRVLVRVIPSLRRRVSQAVEACRTDKPGRYIDRWHGEWLPEMTRNLARLRDVELEELSDEELRRHVDDACELMEQGTLIHMFLHGALAPILHELVTTCDELLGWDAARAMDLVSGTSYKSTEPARRLRELADLARDRPAVRELITERSDDGVERIADIDADFATLLDAYLHEYGCRALGHTTLGEVTLAEAPGLVFGLIDGQLEQNYRPEKHDSNNAERRAMASAEAESLLEGRASDLERLRRVVARATKAYPVREDNQFFCFASPLAILRYSALEIGRRLVNRRVIDTPEDVLYLEFDEALAALSATDDLRPVVERRRGERRWAELNPGPAAYGTPPAGPPSFDFLPPEARVLMEALLWSNEVIMAVDHGESEDAAGASTVRGIAASPGRYSGAVRVVMDETEFHKVRPGDVLVCPITSPVWSVMFPMLGAIVTDTGGVLSHPAIIAREYSIPAVVATGSGTTRFQDGQTVTVDGNTGSAWASA